MRSWVLSLLELFNIKSAWYYGIVQGKPSNNSSAHEVEDNETKLGIKSYGKDER